MAEWWQIWVAIYAAIVATGVGFLEVRRWVEERPRLSISASPNMQTINVRGTEDKTYVMVNVSSRGALPTTITNLGLLEFPNWRQRIRRKSSRSAIITNPSLPGTAIGKLPDRFDPGSLWSGAIDQNQELDEWMHSGRLFVAIYASHSDRPVVERLKPQPKSLEDAERK